MQAEGRVHSLPCLSPGALQVGQKGPLAAVGAAPECKAELHPGAAFHTFAFFKKPVLVLLLSEQKDKNRTKRKASQALQAAGPEGTSCLSEPLGNFLKPQLPVLLTD